MNLSLLYRGPLASCNYGCSYCPFSKRTDSAVQLQRDQAALERFVEWLSEQESHRWKILFTPWGEALVRSWYRAAIARLSHLSRIDSVAIQTNLSGNLQWLAECHASRVSLWATFHPTETTLERFLRQVRRVREAGVSICVGAVGVPEILGELVQLRETLPGAVYMWVNAQQPRRRPYTETEVAQFTAIDPHFALTARRMPSFGKPCPTGETSFTVDGNGDMRRCHFVEEPIGNCYVAGWEEALRARSCPNRFCDCFLGKSQLQADALAPFFGANGLKRLVVGS